MKDKPTSKGGTCLKKYQRGIELTQKQAILAKCADCVNWFYDGKVDCKVPGCPLHPKMQYNPRRKPSHKRQSNLLQGILMSVLAIKQA
jgi:hypothetical protein